MRFAPFAALLATLALAASPHAARAGFDPIFADGFETGDTLRWSTETGDPSAPDLPPDPESVAPPLDLTVATSTAEALEFLWTGPDPIQRDVQPGALEPRRLAALRGRVLWVDGAPLAGVRVSIHAADEVGWTFSRRDGGWDLAINGGGPVTVVFEKDGFISAQRTLAVDWRAWEQVEDVVLLQYDPVSTPIVAGATEMQVARGSVVTDDAGERQATLMFPEEVQAEMVFDDGNTTPLAALTVRATEYTVGPLGPLQMPAPLPENTGYTYAVELSVDEAVAAGAVRVQFDQPLAFYLENYLDFPVGDAVPVGYYDRELAQWIPSDNGRIVEILSVDGGVASLDIEGAGIPASPAELDELGVSPSELVRLALLYPVGTELWRVPITHFTPWDCNWPWGPPLDADTPPDEPDPRDRPDPPPTDPPPVPPTPDPNQPSESTDKGCEKAGSIIECHNQVLREEIPLVGAPWFLSYSSERVKDRGPSVYSLPVVITGPGVSSDLIQVRATVTIAGKRYQQTFPPNPNLTWTISWDGRDLFGRPTQGTQPVVIVREYVYRAIYYGSSRNFVRSFSRLPSDNSFSGSSANRTITVTSRTVSTISRRVRGMGNFDVSREGLGGWSLSAHHRYDPGAQVVFRGDGTRRDSRRIGPLARRFAGNGQWDDSGDGGPAVDAGLLAPKGLAAGPDGSIYIADAMAHRIRRVLPDGTIHTVAGDGTACDPGGGGGTILGTTCGDGGLATEAQLSGPEDVAVAPSGALIIADTANGCVRKVHGGVITTLAGTCQGGGGGEVLTGGDPCSSGCPGSNAPFAEPAGVTVSNRGVVYVADASDRRIWQIDADGWSTPIAGTGDFGDSGDDGPANQATFNNPRDVVVGLDGSLYIADRDANRVRRIRNDGTIVAFAGNGSPLSSGDDDAATLAGVPGPLSLAFGGDGSLYIAEQWGFTVRRVSTNGTISTVAGASDFYGENLDAGMAPEQFYFGEPGGLAVMPGGQLLMADAGLSTVLLVGTELPPWSGEEIRVLDGGEVLVFNHQGRHLRTLHALTGAVLLELGYDANGKLLTLDDLQGNVTTLIRDPDGRVSEIVGPFGQSMVLAYDPQGYLESVEDPLENRWQMVNTTGGLLTEFTPPSQQTWSFDWSATDGRLIRDDDPAGGWQSLTRHSYRRGASGLAYAVRRTTRGGRGTEYQYWESPSQVTTFVRRKVDSLPSYDDFSSSFERADGQFSTRQVGVGTTFGRRGPDAQWGGLAEHSAQSTISRGPAVLSVDRSSDATLTDPADPLSLEERTDWVTVNGREYVSHYDAALRRLTRTSPEGRVSTVDLDARGRPTSIQVGTLLPTTFSYDCRGRLEAIEQGSGPALRRLDLGYDLLGRLETLTDPLLRTVGFSYDDANRVTTQTLPDTRTIGFDWDANGNLTGLTPPGRPEHGFSHTPIDLVAGYEPPTLPGAGSTSYTYSFDRYLTGITRPDGAAIGLIRDIQGRLDRITSPRGNYDFTYQLLGTDPRVFEASDPDGGSITYSWSGPYLISSTWSGEVAGAVARTYDANGWLASRSVNGAHTATFGYDDDGLLTNAGALTITRDPASGLVTGTSLGDVTTTMVYNGFGEPESASASFNGTPLYQVSYTRDQLGRITDKVETIQGVTITWTYRYDLAGRLEEVDQNAVLYAEYGFDQNGNRTGYSGFWGTTTGVYDAQDRMTSYGGATYTYTANGELLTKTVGANVTTYNYDVFGSLRAATLPDGTEIEYVIDAQHRRIGKKVNGVLVQGLLYKDQLNPIAELDGAGAVVSRFVYGTRPHVPEYMVKGGVTYRIVSDHLGSVRLVVDVATGTVAQRIDYDEYGRVLQDTNPGFQPFGFAGGIWDRHVELVRFGWRDYDPETGRWTAKDPAGFDGGSSALYSYADQNPLMFIDPWGLSACTTLIDTLIDLAQHTHLSQLGRLLLLKAQRLSDVPKKSLAFDGFRADLIADGQNGDVHRHIYGHAGSELDWFGGGMLGWYAEREDRQQLKEKPDRGQTRAELAGNQAGRDAGGVLRDLYDDSGYVPGEFDTTPVRDRLVDLLCEPDCK